MSQPSQTMNLQASQIRDVKLPPDNDQRQSLNAVLATGAPSKFGWRDWQQVAKRAVTGMISDRISISAAGCAFYGTLGLFPAISMIISLYGLALDPSTVETQLQKLRHLVPPSAFSLIDDRVHALVAHGAGKLSLSLLISTLLAFWSASSATRSLLGAMNLAYGEKESRSFIRFQLTALGMTFAAIMGAIVAMALLVALPATLAFFDVPLQQAWFANLVSLAVMLVLLLGALAVLYRYGPSRLDAVPWRWVAPGSLAGILLWLPASALFSFYVGHVASYDATYGPLGAVVGLMLWFYVSAYAVLLGAELNAELEQQQQYRAQTPD